MDDDDNLFGDKMFGIPREFDVKKARSGRDAGMKRVLGRDPQWLDGYYRVVRSIPTGAIVSGEDIRKLATPVIGKPHHSNTWGAASNGALRMGLLSKTGNMVTPKASKSHARAIQEYRRT
jgi:hypothetical protein